MDNRLQIYDTGHKSKTGFAGKKAFFRGSFYTYNGNWNTSDKGRRLRWVCNYKGGKVCDAAIISNTNYEVDLDSYVTKPPKHDHPSVTANQKGSVAAICEIRDKAKVNPQLTANQAIDQVRDKLNTAILDKMPTKNAQVLLVNRTRKKALAAPANPTTLEDLGEIAEEFAYRNKRDSLGGNEQVREQWLQADICVGNKRSLIFARPKFLELLGQSDEWLMDGTFGCTPPIFGKDAQLLTIHDRFQETHHTIPCVYAIFTPNKLQNTYISVFKEVRRMTDYAVPRYIYCDFESGMMNGIKIVFLGVEIRACLFHLYQSWRRHLLGMEQEIDTDEQISFQYGLIKGLPWVPLQELDHTYSQLLRIIDVNFFDGFLDYLEKSYVGKLDIFGVRRDGTYSKQIWNVYQRTLNDDFRTNNSVEGYHNKLKKFIRSGYTTIWSFIAKIRDFDETVYSDYRQWTNGQVQLSQKKWRLTQARKLRLVNQWGQPGVNCIDYLRGISSSLDDDI
uniref:MULE transposase domain-containing protein n=1 Tax=Acrobeloides nanus TaxID=290746 RepID=A0A914E4W4_9BILA